MLSGAVFFQRQAREAWLFSGWLGLSVCGAPARGQFGQWLKPAAERPDAMVLLLQAALGFALAWGHFAIQAKRFHDFNWSGWWVLAPGAAIVGLVVTWMPASARRATHDDLRAGPADDGGGRVRRHRQPHAVLPRRDRRPQRLCAALRAAGHAGRRRRLGAAHPRRSSRRGGAAASAGVFGAARFRRRAIPAGGGAAGERVFGRRNARA